MVFRRHGFSLIESLVALILTALILLGTGGMSLTLARTARDTEVHLGVQRDLVMAIDTVQSHLRIASSWSEFTEPKAPVTGGLKRGFTVKGFEYGSGGYNTLVDIQLTDDHRLYVGNRLVSSVIDDFVLDTAASVHVTTVYVKSIDSMPFVSNQHLPMSLTVDVIMRNSPLALETAVNPVFTSGPYHTPTPNSVEIFWTANYEHRGYVEYWQNVNSKQKTYVDVFSSTNAVTIAGLSANKTYTYQLFMRDRYGRLIPHAPTSFTTPKK